jgi:gliding motility-associated-like protein
VVDDCGNMGTDTQTINIDDTTDPVVVAPADFTIEGCDTDDITGWTYSETKVIITNSYADSLDVTEACGIDSVYYVDSMEGTCPVVVTRTFTVVDDCGNMGTDTQTINIDDTTDPTFTAPDDITIYVDEDCEYDADVDYTGDVDDEWDNCSSQLEATYSDEVDDTDACEIIITRTWSLVDDCGNEAEEQIQIITVTDTIPPVIECGTMDLTIYLREHGEYVLSSTQIAGMLTNITDNCTPRENISYSVTPRAFQCIHVGKEVPITITATDACGNSATCTSTVTVLDTIPPVALCRDRTFYLGESGEVIIYPIDVDRGGDRASVPEWARTYNPLEGGSYDACGIEQASISKSRFTIDDVGENIVILTVWDPSGNVDSCEAIVTILDTIPPPPTIDCPDDFEVSTDEGECGATVYYAAESDFDIIYEPAQGSFLPVGTTTVTATAYNSVGDSVSCTFNVTVVDDEEPYIVCPEDIIVTAEPGECEADVIVPSPTEIGDNCEFTYTNDFNGTTDASGSYPAGTTVVTWTVTDDSGNIATCSITVTVITLPDAVDDQASTPENTPVEIDILANDTDCLDSLDPASTAVVTPPQSGDVTIDPATGKALYTPDQNFTGTDMFTYMVCNDDGQCDTATVTISIAYINKPPVAKDDINTTHINTPVSGNVLTNDHDPEGQTLTVSTTPVSNVAHGSVTLNADGSYTYTPANGFTGKDHFEYRVCDPEGLCDTALVTISVFALPGDDNRPPVAVADNYVGKVNTQVTGNLISNDYDPDGDNISINTTPVSPPASGTLTINSDGTFTYVPAEGFTGIVEFEYRICDDGAPSLCDNAIVTIDIRDVGTANTTVAVDDAYFTLENEELEGDVSENDYDPEGDNQVLFTLVVPPSHGSIALLPSGVFEYIPYEGFTGNDQFVYEVCDDGEPVACDKATAYIVVEEAPEDTIPGPPTPQEPCELFIPDGFSPNDDGINDYFKIVCMEDYPNANIEIYNRWGNKVYDKENYGNTDRWGSTDAWWDGRSTNKLTVGSEKLPAGTYFYILYLNDGSDPITGFVFLNR